MNSISNFCSNCGTPLDEGARFCAECGAEVIDLQNSDQNKLEPDQEKQKERKLKNNVASQSEKPNPLPPPNSEKNIRQDKNKTYSEDSSSNNSYVWFNVFIILFVILVGAGISFVYMENQRTDIVDTTKTSTGLSMVTSSSDSNKQKNLNIKIKKAAISYNKIGNDYHKKGEYQKALEYYIKVLKIKEEALGKNHPDTKIIIDIIESIQREMNYK